MQSIKTSAEAARAAKYENATDDYESDNGIYRAPYTLLKKDYGTGKCRIGTHLKLSEDIYSLAYSC